MLWYKKRLLNEADIRDEDDEDDLHIYSDDLTGDLYYFDGEKLIKLKNGSQENPDDPGDDDEFKKLEDEARKKQIEKLDIEHVFLYLFLYQLQWLFQDQDLV